MRLKWRTNNPRNVVPLNRSTVGAVSELRVCVDLASRGCEVYRALSPAAPCDLVVLSNGKLLRVEVKTGNRMASGKISWPIPKPGQIFEVLAVVTSDVIHYFPPDIL